jgi:hypothetical protein
MPNLSARGNQQLLTSLGLDAHSLGFEADDRSPELILVGASSLDEAVTFLGDIRPDDRRKVIVIGLDEDLEFDFRPSPGSFGAVLEDFGILGSMPPHLTTDWQDFGFVGRREVADKLKLWYGGPRHTRNYAIWAGLKDFPSAAAFLLRLVDVVRSESLR